jgi:ABC-type amino acid transport system permease subunit
MLLSVILTTSEAFHIFALLVWLLHFKRSYQNQIKIYFLGISNRLKWKISRGILQYIIPIFKNKPALIKLCFLSYSTHHSWKIFTFMRYNTVVLNHVNSDHVLSFSCLDIWKVRQTTSGVYAITVTTSAYHSRRLGRLKVIVIWRRQGNGSINTGVWYPTICLISGIYKSRSFSFHNADSSK